MDNLEKFYNLVITFINHCVDQDYIPENEEEYIVTEITKIKNQIIADEE